MPSREASMENLEKAMQNWRPPRPWRSREEAQMIRRLVFWWLTSAAASRLVVLGPGHSGISHTWLQKLLRDFRADPNEMWRLQVARGDPTFAQLSRAREYTREMRERGELRPARRPRGIWRRTTAGYGSNGMARSPRLVDLTARGIFRSTKSCSRSPS